MKLTDLKLIKPQLPASKSISNRVLIIRALCGQDFTIHNLSEAIDTQVLIKALASDDLVINVNEAGTAFRFCTALFSIHHLGQLKVLTGAPRLRERPIKDLVESLRSLGAEISYADQEGCAPLSIVSKEIQGGRVEISSSISSQFVSALCMIAPYMKDGLEIVLDDTIVSESYIRMTLSIMKQFGINVQQKENRLMIPAAQYVPMDFTVENDWSAAVNLYIYCLLTGTDIYLHGLNEKSLQGDSAIVKMAQNFGLESRFDDHGVQLHFTGIINPQKEYDLTETPDLAIPFIVFLAWKYPSTVLTGLTTLQHKESDRITALTIELAKTGIDLRYANDRLTFAGQMNNDLVTFDTWNDHRIAMALSLIATYKSIEVNNPEVVSKSWPSYWSQFV
jgi:3-phosphoshikimate 1-carboxyvinyltransferase